VVGSGCQWAIVVLLAKISTPEVVGQFALAMAVAIPITFLADFRLRVLYVTDTQEKYRFREMLGLRFVLACVSLSAILITCAIARFDSYATVVVFAVGVAQLADFLSESYFGKLQRDERMDRIDRKKHSCRHPLHHRCVCHAPAFVGDRGHIGRPGLGTAVL
jgi:O-antigen/teichoic acid export membrane protein